MSNTPRITSTREFISLVVIVVAVFLFWYHWLRPNVTVIRHNSRDGAAMVWIPTGSFPMGIGMREKIGIDASEDGDWRDRCVLIWRQLNGAKDASDYYGVPSHEVFLQGYWIYKYEVTVAQYRAFCKATGRAMPRMPKWGWQDDHPIINVTWADAAAYAAWAGARLPTEAQWEKAARGTDRRLFTWGNDWHPRMWDVYSTGTKRIGSSPKAASPYGCQDMVGSVREWCADWYSETYNTPAFSRNPTGPATGSLRVVRGGGWDSFQSETFFATYRLGLVPSHRDEYGGFRCVIPGK